MWYWGYLFFGFAHLGSFVTADEGHWIYERIPNYWEAIHDHTWKKTFINDKPGVSVALAGLPGLLLNRESREHCQEDDQRIIVCDVAHSESLLRAFRSPLVLINGFLLVLLFFVLGRLVNPWVGLWSTILIGFSPPLIGISQIVNPDALLWSFGSVSTFAFFLSLKTGEKKWAIFSGMLLGMALLSKYVALILWPFYFGVVLLVFLVSENEETTQKSLRHNLKLWLILGGVVLLTVCFFLPAFVISPEYYLSKYLFSIENKQVFLILGLFSFAFVLSDVFLLKGRVFGFLRKRSVWVRNTLPWITVFLGGVFLVIILLRSIFPEWDIFSRIPFDAKELTTALYYGVNLNFLEMVILEFSPLAFSLTPVVLIGLGCLCGYIWRQRHNLENFWVNIVALFVFLYTGTLIMTNVFTTIRYSILLYPFMGFLGAMGFWYVSGKWTSRWKYLLITIVIFMGSIASVFSVKPFYFNYTNMLLSKGSVLSDAWGYGGYEAAQYLNTLPDAKHLTVWADYYGVCEFFVGKCLTAYSFDGNSVKPDYFVLTRRGNIRYGSRFSQWEKKSGLTAYKYYVDTEPAWQLVIDGHPGNYIRVIEVPVEDKE